MKNSMHIGKYCTDLWYKEVAYHDFKKDHQKKSGHFTQLVWKSSELVGFGMAMTKNNVICVAEYYPAGNVLRKFKLNVFPKSNSTTTKKTTKKATTTKKSG